MLQDLSPSQIAQQVWSESALLWAVENAIKTESGKPLEFTNHRFLKDIFDDWTQIQTCRKASQIGFSTMIIAKTLYAAKYKQWNIIYTLPTVPDVQQFVSSKVNAMIDHSDLLSEWVKDKDTILQKKVGDRFIYYRGTFSGKTQKEKMESGVGIMLSSDLNVADECDRSDQIILEQYDSRLEASEFGGKWYFSNPTTPHTISQKYWDISDQKHWFIKCKGCNYRQYLDFWKNVVENRYVCKKCGKILDDDTRRHGEWVEKHVGKDISGYWINHLMCPWIPASKIVTTEQTKSKAYFHNFVLGLPYVGAENVVNKDIILRSIDYTKSNKQENNVIGVDSGNKKHYVLGNEQGIFKVGVTESWDDIEEMIKLYDIRSAVLDGLPDLTQPRKLKVKYPGIVWLSFFKKEVKSAEHINWDDKTYSVYSDHSRLIQQVIDEFIDDKIRFQMKPEELIDYIDHWQAFYRTIETDSLGIEREVWESSGEDHYGFATFYWWLALQRGTNKLSMKEYGEAKILDPNAAPDIHSMLRKMRNNT